MLLKVAFTDDCTMHDKELQPTINTKLMHSKSQEEFTTKQGKLYNSHLCILYHLAAATISVVAAATYKQTKYLQMVDVLCKPLLYFQNVFSHFT